MEYEPGRPDGLPDFLFPVKIAQYFPEFQSYENTPQFSLWATG